MIPYKIVVFLSQDTIDHLDAIAVAIGKKKGNHPNRSDAVKHLVMKHWKKTMLRRAEKAHEKPRLTIID